jgi:hypothetical protein
MAAGDFLDSTGATLTVGTGSTTAAAFTLFLRDMGTQVSIPGDYTTGTLRRVLRKVQIVDPNATSLVSVTSNYNEGVSGVVTGTTASAQGNVTQPGYGCFYIEVSGLVGLGVKAQGIKFVSINLPTL